MAESEGGPAPLPSSDSYSCTSSDQYRCLVVDSGPIIRTGVPSLWKGAHAFFTVPAVIEEIRDAKARQHLENLPVELVVREASSEGIRAVIEFSKQTGDYQSLSSVDLQVLGLLYDLEQEGCLDMSHVRKTPKRMLGLGKIESLGISEAKESEILDEEESSQGSLTDDEPLLENDEKTEEIPDEPVVVAPQRPISWAKAVDPNANEMTRLDTSDQLSLRQTKDADITKPFGQMNLRGEDSLGGQFSDAEDEDSIGVEEGDSETEDLKRTNIPVEQELKLDFPSLAASVTVPYEGSDDEQNEDDEDPSEKQRLQDELEEARKQKALEMEEARKQEALRPLSKSGKLYNSFRKYGDLMKPAQRKKDAPSSTKGTDTPITSCEQSIPEDFASNIKNQSRIIGGNALAGQEADIEDDGEGWITCSNFQKMKATGSLDPKQNPDLLNHNGIPAEPIGPLKSQRAACATTDFAMQNVILQMGLELLSVDGVKVRKLKSWVVRCGACYKVYTSEENGSSPLGSKRLFCGRCGSDMMQRIAASVDGKTGRLRLHLSKRYKHNLRGTKFSLPKPGTGNRFQGDLLLREDQLLMGAWNQKAKMRSGGKAKSAAQSMFGKDIATNVGCHTRSLADEDIRVGFGRRNPNAAKGRERRGKKKKSVDTACGLRRY